MNSRRTQPLPPEIRIDWIAFPNATLSDALYASLRRAIVNGKISPGTPLKEMEVSRQANVSRTPVREVFRRLESERMLLRLPGRKFVVTSPDPSEMEEVFLVRSVLEGLAGRIAAAKMNVEHIEGLRGVVKKMERGTKENRLDLAIESNLEFHKLIVEICNNNVLAQTLERLWDMVRMMSMTNLEDKFWVRRSVNEHRRIVDALEKKDGLFVEKLIRDHVLHAGKIFTSTEFRVGREKRMASARPRGSKGKKQIRDKSLAGQPRRA